MGIWTEPDPVNSNLDISYTAAHYDAKTATLTFASGRTYVGQVADGRPCGQGLEVDPLPDGSNVEYEGGWRDGLYHGQGILRHRGNGSVFEGAFVAGLRCGYGMHVFGRGAGQYAGDFVDDQPHGNGTWKYADGSSFEGAWVAGQKNGPGVLTLSDGTVTRGLWLNDEMLKAP